MTAVYLLVGSHRAAKAQPVAACSISMTFNLYEGNYRNQQTSARCLWVCKRPICVEASYASLRPH